MTMKKILPLFILIVAVSCGQERTYKTLLTNNKWTIKKVENLDLGQLGPDELNEGTLWIFNRDNTFTFEMKNKLWDKRNTGTWILVSDSLTLFVDSGTTSLRIEKLTDKDLIWTMVEEDTLRFTLMSSVSN
jgi:hypothetical protein